MKLCMILASFLLSLPTIPTGSAGSLHDQIEPVVIAQGVHEKEIVVPLNGSTILPTGGALPSTVRSSDDTVAQPTITYGHKVEVSGKNKGTATITVEFANGTTKEYKVVVR